MSYRVALIKGDGIGPEQAAATTEVLSAVAENFGLSFDFIPVEAGDATLKKYGAALPDASLKTITECDSCLKGPVGATAYDVIIKMRQQLDLFANIRPAKSMPNVPSLNSKTDLVIVRENTEDLYVGLESGDEQKAIATRVITRKASERIARYAFELARQRKNSVVAIHKVNVMKKTDGLFLSACRGIASSYCDVQFSDMLVDAAAMNLIRNPQAFDVIVTTNMFGDILSDEAAQVVGGLGLAASANIGERFAIFEPVHGCAPDIAGKNIANPISMILSASMMLDWLGEKKKDQNLTKAAKMIHYAVESSLRAGECTQDLGGKLTTLEMAKAIKKRLSEN
ncbi:MAG TPA: isocitrate/isopropylmalate dehydrogenase family protein [Candidatus Acidoferrum sp.]|nr:isocitrate/isopropylmalate dehydrogenase family protein [Candidatus Acidoferrum sp.]